MVTEEIIISIPPLVVKYLFNELSASEHTLLFEWVNQSSENQLLFQEITDKQAIWEGLQAIRALKKEEPACYKRLTQTIGFKNQPVAVIISFLLRFKVAAAIVVLVAGAIIVYLSLPATRHAAEKIVSNDIAAPTGSHAQLRLSNNQIIILDSVGSQTVRQEGNTEIQIEKDQITYRPGMSSPAAPVLFNTVSTSRGGFYMVALPDGSKAWLNAGSSIKFPVAFTGNERNVFITGEVYFDVRKNSKPFKVIPEFGDKDNRQCQVEVMGTHFDVNAYPEENAVTTTLLEGRVKMQSSANRAFQRPQSILKPGQQAQLTKAGELKLSEADTTAAIAWKNHEFNFNGRQDIQTSMRQIARWYNVEVDYDKNIGNIYPMGTISRSFPLKSVLNIIEGTGSVTFHIEGNSVKVLPGTGKQ